MFRTRTKVQENQKTVNLMFRVFIPKILHTFCTTGVEQGWDLGEAHVCGGHSPISDKASPFTTSDTGMVDTRDGSTSENSFKGTNKGLANTLGVQNILD